MFLDGTCIETLFIILILIISTLRCFRLQQHEGVGESSSKLYWHTHTENCLSLPSRPHPHRDDFILSPLQLVRILRHLLL